MPHAIRLSGTQIVEKDSSKAQPLPEGWQYVTPEQFVAAQAMGYPNYVDGQVVNIEPPEPTAAEIEAQRSVILADKTVTLNNTYRDYLNKYFSMATLSLVFYGSSRDLPKCLVVQEWLSTVYDLYQQKAAYLTYVFDDFDFSEAGEPPYTQEEINQEVNP